MVGGKGVEVVCGEGTDKTRAVTKITDRAHHKGGPGDIASKICRFQTEREPLLSYLKEQHERYLREVTQLSVPVEKSCDLSRPDALGCKVCDVRAGALVKVPIAATLRMKDQITFQPPLTETDVGHFTYNRVFYSLFKYFPSCQREAKISARRVIAKLNSNDAWLAAEATYKARKLFLQGNTKWLTIFDLQQPKLTFINLHIVLNLQHDSTSVRMTIVPNKVYKIDGGRELTFNDCVQNVASKFPKPQKFAFYDQFSFGMLHSDLSSMFSSVLYSYQSSLQTLTYCLQTPDLKPTFLLSEAKDETLHCLRSRVVEFGNKDAPAACSQALTMCVQAYRVHKLKTRGDPITEYMLNCIDQVCREDCHMDDLAAAFTLPRLWKYVEVTDKTIPLPACVCGETCVARAAPALGEDKDEQDVMRVRFACCPLAAITDELWREHDLFLQKVSKEFLTKFAETLCKVMNFCNFRLKFMKSNQCDQNQLDNLVRLQTVYTPSDEEIGVTKPNKEQMREAISKMRPGPELTFKGLESEIPGQVHLSHSYCNQGVFLKIKHLVISCTVNGRKQKSTEIFSFQDYIRWKSEVNPTLTKRSLFSLLSQNFCYSGRFLVYYKTMMKTLIRATLLANPAMGWDTALCPETISKVELAIQVYFKLVHQLVPRPENFNSYFAQFFAILTTDASMSIMGQTLTIISVTNLCGKLIVKSQHVELSCFAAHVSAVSIPFLELLSFLRGCQSLYSIIQELKSAGVNIPPQNRKILVDNRIIMAQIRSPCSNFVKRVCQAVAKGQLLLHDLGMNPFFHVHFLDQSDKRVTFFADILTKVNWSHSPEQIIGLQKRLMDTSWLNKQHPEMLPGCSRTVGLPQMTNDEWMNVAGVSEKELDMFRSNLHHKLKGKEESKKLAAELVRSASTVVKPVGGSINDSNVEQTIEARDDEDEVSFEEYIFSDDEDEVSFNEQTLFNEGGEVNEEVSKSEKEPTVAPVKTLPGGGGSVKPPVKRLHLTTKKVSESEKEPTVTPAEALPKGNGVTPHVQVPAPPAAERVVKWKTTLDNLIKAHHSKGVGNRSAVAILGRVYQFIDLTRKHTLNPDSKNPIARKKRQQRRLAEKLEHERKALATHKKRSKTCSMKDEHFLCCTDLDLDKSLLGSFDFCWKATVPPPKDKEDEYQTRALQHLLSIFHCNKTVRGFRPMVLPANNMLDIYVLRGRRQRDYLRKGGFSEVRLRKVEEKSSLESCLLWSAHRHSRGLSMHKAISCLLSLNVYIGGAERKLQQVKDVCSSCARRKASLGRDSDKIRVSRMSPNDYAKWPNRWLSGVNTVLTDLHGPIFLHHHPGGSVEKAYIVCFLEMPFHNFVPIMAASLSAAHLLLAVDTYASQRKTSCDLVLSDFGSNMSRMQNEYSELEWDEDEEAAKTKAWHQVLTAQHGKTQMKNKGIYVRFAQGRHSCVGAIEQAQFQIKVALHSFNHHRRKEPLTYFQWQLVLQTASLIISSRPVLISEGRIFSHQSLMRLMGEAGRGLGQSGIGYHTKGSRLVTKELLDMTAEIKQLRYEIAEAFLTHLVKESFLEIINRKQLTRRKETDSVKCKDIFFCQRLFKSTGSVTGSLLRLERMGLSHNHGLFRRVSTHRGDRQIYIGRGLNELFFICGGEDTISLQQNHQLETYEIKKDLPALEKGMEGYDTFSEEEEEASNEGKENERKGDEKANRASQEGEKEVKKTEFEKKREEDLRKNSEAVVTRSGRVVRQPPRFQPS